MPRVKKKTEMVPVEKPSRELADYSDTGSALIRLGTIMWQKGNNLLEDGKEGNVSQNSLPLSLQQVQYLNMRMAGISLAEACKLLKIDSISPMLWEEEGGKTSLYNCCVEAVKRKQALFLEDKLWDRAINCEKLDKTMGDLLKYALQARMDEYKSNAPVTNVPVQVILKVAGKRFEIEEDMKMVEEVDEDEDG